MTRSLLFFFTIALAASKLEGQYTLSTIAGGGPDGIPAVTASIRSPSGLGVDSSGSLYIAAGLYANRLFKVPLGGQLQVFAGTGEAGLGSDSVSATAGLLSSPSGIAVDSSGRVYFSDTGTHRLRRVYQGILLTVAGTGTPGYNGENVSSNTAQLNRPVGVAQDASGNIYIADSGNHRIRRIAAATGLITTVAGTGTAGFSGDGSNATLAQLSTPMGITVDSAGNLYIADTGNQRIRKVDAGGTISTIAGTGTAGFSGDGGSALVAQLNNPSAVLMEASGNLYVADSANHRVRKIASGIITTFAGTGTAGFAGDGGAATAAQLNYPTALALSSSGTLYIADFLNLRVRSVSSGTITTVAGNGTPFYGGDGSGSPNAVLNGPAGLTRDSSGNLYVADTFNHRIRAALVAGGRMITVGGNGTAGNSGDSGPAIYAQLNAPQGVAADSSGALYVADTENHRIRRIASGNIFAFAGNGTAGYSGDGGSAATAQFNHPAGIAVDSAGTVYVADTYNHRIRKISGGIVTTIAGTGVAGFSGDGGAGTLAQLRYPYAVALDTLGNLYIADTLNHRIRKLSSSGIITTVAGTGQAGYNGDSIAATSANLSYPGSVAADWRGNVIIADTGNHRIRKVYNGVISTAAGTGTPGFNGDGAGASVQLSFPGAVIMDGSGALYISDSTNGRLRYGYPTP